MSAWGVLREQWNSPLLCSWNLNASKVSLWFVWPFPFYHYFTSRDSLQKRAVSNKVGNTSISSEQPKLVKFIVVIHLKTKCRSGSARQLSVEILSYDQNKICSIFESHTDSGIAAKGNFQLWYSFSVISSAVRSSWRNEVNTSSAVMLLGITSNVRQGLSCMWIPDTVRAWAQPAFTVLQASTENVGMLLK